VVKIAWRKSWVFENIQGKNGDGKASKRELEPDERSIWDDFLDLATPPLTPISGQICISKEVGYTLTQLSAMLKSPKELIKRAANRMVEMEMITRENNGIVVINNYHNWQSEYERQKHYRLGLQKGVISKGDKKGNTVDIDRDIDKIKSIYLYWNTLNIFTHKVPDKHYTAIAAALNKGYTEEEIKTSMGNYATILKSPRYRWTYKWECCFFVQRGLEKFMDLKLAKSNFMHGEAADEEVEGLEDLAGKEKK